MKKVLIVAGLLAIGLVAACGLKIGGEKAQSPAVFPTATSHFFFQSDSTPSAIQPNTLEPIPVKPTVASIFFDYPTTPPFSYGLSSGAEPAQGTPTPGSDILPTPTPIRYIYEVPVYQDDLNQNWDVQKSTGIEIHLNDTSQVSRGKSAVTFTPLDDFGILFFTVTGKSREVYTRDKVATLSLWLYTGDETLSIDQLSAGVITSNSPIYWSADDHPMTVVDQDPVLSETRSYFLDLNRSVPARNWVQIEFDLTKDLTTDPDLPYLTGFFLKTEAGFSRTLVVDDIMLEMIGDGSEKAVAATQQPADRKTVIVQVDTQQEVHPISELIYGVSGAPKDYLSALRPSLNNWGGSISTRYNWKIGHAWNTGSQGSYRNDSFGLTSGSASDDFISQTLDAGAGVRLTLPTLGWVAKNDDPNTCSFPLPDGTCGNANGATCREPGIIADPYAANTPYYPSSIIEWIQYLTKTKAYKIRFLALDNEPELWGFTHYDVHPACTTYDEILKKHLLYTAQLHTIVPEMEFVGPVTSGWYYYWTSAAGDKEKSQHENLDFLPWFLRKVKLNDQSRGWRSLHALDIHYYPEGLYNDKVDEKTAAHRLRSTRSLWDKNYADESPIDEPIYLIPRMKELIDQNYPGTKLGISEWNWGAEKSMNGALAIADVLGIFGREDLYYATYWQYPPINSPGFFAFKMYANFDDQGSRFGDTSVMAESGDIDTLSSYAALNSASGDLYVMLVHKQAVGDTLAKINLANFAPDKYADMYRYDAAYPERITNSTAIISGKEFSVNLPASSITLLVIHPGQ